MEEKDPRPVCPQTETFCPHNPPCELFEGTGRTYCRAWVTEQQAAGKARFHELEK